MKGGRRSHNTEEPLPSPHCAASPRTAYPALPHRPGTWPAPPEPRRSTPTKGGDSSRTLRASLRLHVSRHRGGHVSTLLAPLARLAHAADMARTPAWRTMRCCRAASSARASPCFFSFFFFSPHHLLSWLFFYCLNRRDGAISWWKEEALRRAFYHTAAGRRA